MWKLRGCYFRLVTQATRIPGKTPLVNKIFASSVGNRLHLEREASQDRRSCDTSAYQIQWKSSIVHLPLNRKYINDIGLSDNPDTFVLIDIAFATTYVRKMSNHSQSFQSMFGSLGGWVGVLSNGWELYL